MIDFHRVQDSHRTIDRGLQNWCEWVKPRQPSWISPMFRMAKSNSRQYHAPELRDDVFPLLAMEMEKAVFELPKPHRAAVRWAYVYRDAPIHECRRSGLSMDGLSMVLRDGRQMLINLGAERYCPTPIHVIDYSPLAREYAKS